MKRLWLLFAQTTTVLLATYFVVLTLKPQWVGGSAVPAGAPESISIIQAAPAPAGSAGGAPESLSAAVRKAAPAVVSINTSTTMRHPFGDDPWFRFFFGDAGAQQQSGLGSGVIMSAQGYVLTNNHVVEGADAIEVVLPDARSAAAKVIGTDPESDLAVLKIELDQLPVMVLGNSDQLQVGDRVLAIGNPFGVGQTVTSGIVSALGRNQLGINTFENFIQTDAAINPGNSGGALTDVHGNLMGINTAIYSRSGGSLGIGFAIPVSTARQVLESIIRHGQVVRGWVGIEPGELTPELAQTFGVRVEQGVMVTGVLGGGPAAQAGIRPGDVITGIGTQPVRTQSELLTRIAGLAPGQAVDFSVHRRGQQLALRVTPAQRPRPHQPGAR
ncbi:MAG TPA: trypsin-like peptidase domain-containing protein [Ottowia sp.]|uniref:trypsin-like peptidase domain-containing protein n=1 Tax=Ottowia sp. TaxID=1898956 RepID=UPI002BABDFA3|nr:trypsin-like peptidase domain-containing protein [Ottowia sp.]HMN19887.1 trypsin-like peptidase domain-containing protein [Ottowia sp.]